MQYQFIINKIKCQGCLDSIIKAINDFSDTKIIATDIDAKTISIETIKDKSLILNKLSEIGFPAEN